MAVAKRIWIIGALLSFLLPTLAMGQGPAAVPTSTPVAAPVAAVVAPATAPAAAVVAPVAAPAATPALAAALETEIVDKALSAYGPAEGDCGKVEALASQLAAAVAARPTAYEYRLMSALALVKASAHCSVPAREEWLRRAQAQAAALRTQAATLAGAPVKPLAMAGEALVKAGYGDYDGALALSAEALRLGRGTALVQLARAETLSSKAAYLVARDGDASEGSRVLDKEALGLVIEATHLELPKSLMALGNVMAARLQERIGEPALAVQYYKNYVAVVADNPRALLELSDALFRSDECRGAEETAQKAQLLVKSATAQHLYERAHACVETKGARALATAGSAPSAAAPAQSAAPANAATPTEAKATAPVAPPAQ